MKKYSWFILMITLFSIWFYFMFFHVKTVEYAGSNELWDVNIRAKLAGSEGSNSIYIKYNGEESIYLAEYLIHPNYGNGIILGESMYQSNQQGTVDRNLSLDSSGIYERVCVDNCGYYDKEEELQFFIHWKNDKGDEGDTSLIELQKVNH